MLVLRRTEGQWVEITHAATGDVIRFRVYDLAGGYQQVVPGRVHLAFEDRARNFAVERPERARRAAARA
jgi:hypothetical protein